MKEESNCYKGYDFTNTNKSSKLREEYFNPYGYNLESTGRNIVDVNYKCTHTNQNNKIK